MEEKTKKLNFWNKLNSSIFKLEEYTLFLEEKISSSIKYFLKLILLIVVIISSVQTGMYVKMLIKGYNYFENELPGFEYSNKKLKFEKNVNAYDDEYKFYLFVNTDENVSEETIKNYKNEIYNTTNGMIVLENKLIYITPINEVEYDLKMMAEQYAVDKITKKEIIDEYNKTGNFSVGAMLFITIVVENYLLQFFDVLSYVLLLAAFGMFAAMICGIRIKFTPMMKLSLHAITLPVILKSICILINMVTNFEIAYYEIMILLIAYVYIVAIILIIKSDLLKQREELIKIEAIQKEVEKEIIIEREDKKEKEKQEDKNKEEQTDKPELNDAEPDGSEI